MLIPLAIMEAEFIQEFVISENIFWISKILTQIHNNFEYIKKNSGYQK